MEQRQIGGTRNKQIGDKTFTVGWQLTGSGYEGVAFCDDIRITTKPMADKEEAVNEAIKLATERMAQK